jgi:hypothetical protein
MTKPSIRILALPTMDCPKEPHHLQMTSSSSLHVLVINV